ncbi:MAG TPA: ArsA family ATPase [Polyangia bacterium]|nr:ArsA family ATPase [Polyangia bacterium]
MSPSRAAAQPLPAQRFRFFGGKGGVGKTTCAAAAAVAAAASGGRVLLVSTDPAHSLGDALSVPLSARPQHLPTRRGALAAVELAADRALARWLRARLPALRTIAARGTYLDQDDIDELMRLALPGVDELMGLVELLRLARSGPWEEVVVDTAPTGHTLRLLAMPETLRRIAGVLDDMQAKHRFLAHSLSGAYEADAADAVIEDLDAEGQGLAALLSDPNRTGFVWIMLPEPMAIEEARDGVRALGENNLPVAEIVVNRVTPPPRQPCALCAGRVLAERAALAAARAAFPGFALRLLPAQEREPRGQPALLRLGRALSGRGPGQELLAGRIPKPPVVRARPRAAVDWPSLLGPPGLRLLAFGGKGGVGKTTCAATTALALAARDPSRRILLLSADPAHSLGDVLGAEVGDAERPVPHAPPRLRARELDADRAFAERRQRYRAAVDELFDGFTGGSRFDAVYDRQVVQDLIDLAPPGLDELFAVLSLTDALLAPPGRRPRYQTVVLDTAPTGHAVRLLKLPEAALDWVHALLSILLKYRRVVGLGELAEDLVGLARELRALGQLLRDKRRTRFVVVTRPAELPGAETARLVSALGRLHIPVGAVVYNAVTPPGCARCLRIRAAEQQKLARLPRRRGAGWVMLQAPARAPPPRGAAALRRFGGTWSIRT